MKRCDAIYELESFLTNIKECSAHEILNFVEEELRMSPPRTTILDDSDPEHIEYITVLEWEIEDQEDVVQRENA